MWESMPIAHDPPMSNSGVRQPVGLIVITGTQIGQSANLTVITSAQTGQSVNLTVVTSFQP